MDNPGDKPESPLANIDTAHKAMDRNTARIGGLVAGLTLGRKTEADTQLKLAARDKALFKLQRERTLAHLESQRRQLVNQRMQAEIERAAPSSEDNVILVHNALQIPNSPRIKQT